MAGPVPVGQQGVGLALLGRVHQGVAQPLEALGAGGLGAHLQGLRRVQQGPAGRLEVGGVVAPQAHRALPGARA